MQAQGDPAGPRHPPPPPPPHEPVLARHELDPGHWLCTTLRHDPGHPPRPCPFGPQLGGWSVVELSEAQAPPLVHMHEEDPGGGRRCGMKACSRRRSRLQSHPCNAVVSTGGGVHAMAHTSACARACVRALHAAATAAALTRYGAHCYSHRCTAATLQGGARVSLPHVYAPGQRPAWNDSQDADAGTTAPGTARRASAPARASGTSRDFVMVGGSSAHWHAPLVFLCTCSRSRRRTSRTYE